MENALCGHCCQQWGRQQAGEDGLAPSKARVSSKTSRHYPAVRFCYLSNSPVMAEQRGFEPLRDFTSRTLSRCRPSARLGHCSVNRLDHAVCRLSEAQTWACIVMPPTGVFLFYIQKLIKLDAVNLYTQPVGQIVGGNGGIRTHGWLTPSAVFKTVALNQLGHVSITEGDADGT